MRSSTVRFDPNLIDIFEFQIDMPTVGKTDKEKEAMLREKVKLFVAL